MPVKIFCSYVREDEPLLNRLKVYLMSMKRRGLIDIWDDHELIPGRERIEQFQEHLKNAQIILLLVSPDFLASELYETVERYKQDKALMIPIILSPSYGWQEWPFGKLAPLPTDGKPVTTWSNREKAFVNVVEGIARAVGQEAIALATEVRKDVDHSILISKARGEMDHLIRLYKDIRYFIPPTWDRARNTDNVWQSMQEQAKRARYTLSETTGFLLSLDEGERLAGLAILQWREDDDPQNVENFEQMIGLMDKPRSPYEHYHTLEILKRMEPHLSDHQRDKLRDAVHNHIYDRNADSDQWPAFSREILGWR